MYKNWLTTLHKLTLPFRESWPVVGKTVAVRCLDVAHGTDAADGGEVIHSDVRWHMINVQYSQRASKFHFSQTADNKFKKMKRFTQKKKRKCKIKINFY